MLPPSELAEMFGLTAKKSLGQNFLFDLNITRKIVRHTGSLEGKNIIEIGPGPGGLTQAILEASPAKIIAIEFDERAIKCLEALNATNLEILNKDALRINLSEIVQKPAIIMANLPYNIGTKLLTNWFKYITHFECLTLMFQKEVAERIAAKPNSSAYGRLSVISQYLCEVEILFDIPPEAFTPRPKVTSSVIKLLPKQKPEPAVNVENLEKTLKAAFSQRRKMLKVSLKQIFSEPEKVLNKAGITPTRRPQELSVSEFCQIANLL